MTLAAPEAFMTTRPIARAPTIRPRRRNSVRSVPASGPVVTMPRRRMKRQKHHELPTMPSDPTSQSDALPYFPPDNSHSKPSMTTDAMMYRRTNERDITAFWSNVGRGAVIPRRQGASGRRRLGWATLQSLAVVSSLFPHCPGERDQQQEAQADK